MTRIISSQRYIDDEIVEAKRAARDYQVTLTPAFEVEPWGTVQVIVDGHHSLEAARLDGVEPVYTEATDQTADTIAMIETGRIDDFLATSRMDSDYYDVETGQDL